MWVKFRRSDFGRGQPNLDRIPPGLADVGLIWTEFDQSWTDLDQARPDFSKFGPSSSRFRLNWADFGQL